MGGTWYANRVLSENDCRAQESGAAKIRQKERPTSGPADSTTSAEKGKVTELPSNG